MRTVGIVLLLLGGLLIATGFLRLSTTAEPASNSEPSALQQRLDAFIPGIALLGIGFVLVSLSRRPVTITATPADRWLSISLTAAAAEFARQTIQERSYPAESGLRIAPDPSKEQLLVQFDLPSDDEADWLGEDQGIPVFVDDLLAPRAMGATIDLHEGRLIVVHPGSVSVPR